MFERNADGKTLQQQCEEALNQIGLSIMDNHKAAKLLAFTYVFGTEDCVSHPQFHSDIMVAQQKFHIFGAECVTPVGLVMIQTYIEELEQKREKCEWLYDLLTPYNIKMNGVVQPGQPDVPENRERTRHGKRGKSV